MSSGMNVYAVPGEGGPYTQKVKITNINDIRGGGALTVPSSHFFTTTMERDAYFIANLTELVEGAGCVVSGVLQKYQDNAWVDMTAAIQGPVGPQGIPGTVGPTGPTGPAGTKGDKGDKGDTGAAGPTGATGATGDKGDKGDKGDTGDAGPQGDPGPTGPAGATGATGGKGDKGDDGDPGESLPPSQANQILGTDSNNTKIWLNPDEARQLIGAGTGTGDSLWKIDPDTGDLVPDWTGTGTGTGGSGNANHVTAGSALAINGETLTPTPPNPVDLTFVGRVMITNDVANGRSNIEILNTNGGSGNPDDPEAPVGWGNWPVGDSRWLPGLTVAPPGTVKQDGSFHTIEKLSNVLNSPFVTLSQNEVVKLPAYSSSQSLTLPYMTDNGGNRYYATNTPRGASSSTDYGKLQIRCFQVNSPFNLTGSGNPWRNNPYWGVKFAAEARHIAAYNIRPTARYVYGSGFNSTLDIDGWDVYGATVDDPDWDTDDDWTLIDSRRQQCRTTNGTTETVNYIAENPGEYTAIKFVLRHAVAAVSGGGLAADQWAPDAGDNAVISIYGCALYGLNAVYVLPTNTVENGVDGIWCLRYEEGSFGQPDTGFPAYSVQEEFTGELDETGKRIYRKTYQVVTTALDGVEVVKTIEPNFWSTRIFREARGFIEDSLGTRWNCNINDGTNYSIIQAFGDDPSLSPETMNLVWRLNWAGTNGFNLNAVVFYTKK